jgi:TolA-binding protein
MWYNIVKKAATEIIWDPKTRTAGKGEGSPMDPTPTGQPTPDQIAAQERQQEVTPSPADMETARLQKLLQLSQTRLQLIQAQQQIESIESGAIPAPGTETAQPAAKPKTTSKSTSKKSNVKK